MGRSSVLLIYTGGTGLRDYDNLVVGSKAELESLQQAQ